MKIITIRLEDDVFNKIEEQRGTKFKSEFYRELIEYFLNKPEYDLNNSEYTNIQQKYTNIQCEYEKIKSEYDSIKTELQHLIDIMSVKDERINDLQKQVGFLQLEYQKVSDRLMLPAPDKKWWQFWK